MVSCKNVGESVSCLMVVSGSVEDLLLSQWSVFGGSVEDLSKSRWSVGWWSTCWCVGCCLLLVGRMV